MRLDDLVIPNTGTLSNIVSLEERDKLTLYGAAAYTGVITLEASFDGTTFVTTGLTLAAAVLLRVDSLQGSHVRLNSSLAEGAARTTQIHATGSRLS